MTAPALILATSLSPRDDRGVQPGAIRSWLSHGAKVLAINTADEIDGLQGSFPDVQFVEARRTAEQLAGRPVPYIFDLLTAAKENSNEGDTLGVINADIFLREIQGLKAFLAAESQGAVILGPRVDVPDKSVFQTYRPASNPNTEPTYSVGYDYFVMSRDIVDDFADSPFAMGMPFWDYWLPLTAYLAGRPLKTLKSPVALHVQHETRWADTTYVFFHALIAYALEQSRTDAESDTPHMRQLAFFLNVITHHYGSIFENGTGGQGGVAPDGEALAALADFYDRFQETAVHTIKANATTIRLESP